MWALFYSSTALGGLGEHRREHAWDHVSELDGPAQHRFERIDPMASQDSW